MAHEYLNAFINNSSTVTEKAGVDLENPAHKAAAYDEDGNAVIAADGKSAFGVILCDTPDIVKTGESVNILIKNIGLLEAGEAISKGDAVTINDEGVGVKAASGSFIFGFAFSAASKAGELIQVQINRSGTIQSGAAQSGTTQEEVK